LSAKLLAFKDFQTAHLIFFVTFVPSR